MRTKIGLKNEIKCWEINSKEKNYKGIIKWAIKKIRTKFENK